MKCVRSLTVVIKKHIYCQILSVIFRYFFASCFEIVNRNIPVYIYTNQGRYQKKISMVFMHIDSTKLLSVCAMHVLLACNDEKSTKREVTEKCCLRTNKKNFCSHQNFFFFKPNSNRRHIMRIMAFLRLYVRGK